MQVRSLIQEATISERKELEKKFATYFKYLTLSDNNPFSKIYIYKDKKILGFIAYSEIYERCELDYLAIDIIYQRKGIASSLLQFMLQNTPCKEISLEVNENNRRAILFYQKFGFQKVAIRPNYYGKQNAYIMILSR